MNQFAQILNGDPTPSNENSPEPAPQAGKTAIVHTQNPYWNIVLLVAKYTDHPATKLLSSLREIGAGMKLIEKEERHTLPGGKMARGTSAHFKLDQGAIPEVQWADIRARELSQIPKEDFMWLFTFAAMIHPSETIDVAGISVAGIDRTAGQSPLTGLPTLADLEAAVRDPLVWALANVHLVGAAMDKIGKEIQRMQTLPEKGLPQPLAQLPVPIAVNNWMRGALLQNWGFLMTQRRGLAKMIVRNMEPGESNRLPCLTFKAPDKTGGDGNGGGQRDWFIDRGLIKHDQDETIFTPEETVVIGTAQSVGLLATGADAARRCVKWWSW